MAKIFQIFTLALSLLLVTGCGGGGDVEVDAPLKDTIEILSVTPATAAPSTQTTFTVQVRYTLASQENGVINIGFFKDENLILDRGELAVARGKSSGTLTVTTVPSQYQTSPNFALGAILSTYPHTVPWTPLARAEKWVIQLIN